MPKKNAPRKPKKNIVLVRLGTKIAEARHAQGLSQEEFAHAMGMHRTYAGMIERGERNPTIINLLRACTALGVKPGDLLDDLPPVGPKDQS